VVALTFAPPLIHRFGERRVATLGFASASVAIAGLGLVDQIARVLDPIFVFQPAGVNEQVLTASLCSIPLGIGTTLAAAATQTYVGRNVPAAIHGRAFAVLGLLKDGLAVGPLLAFGYAASVVGIRPVLVSAPVALFALAAGVAWWSSSLARRRGADAERGTPAT
jgi:MFS family permease